MRLISANYLMWKFMVIWPTRLIPTRRLECRLLHRKLDLLIDPDSYDFVENLEGIR